MKEVRWKFTIINGQLVRECTNCGYRSKKEPIYCPECKEKMTK